MSLGWLVFWVFLATGVFLDRRRRAVYHEHLLDRYARHLKLATRRSGEGLIDYRIRVETALSESAE